jgi:molecular chaperone HtpG
MQTGKIGVTSENIFPIIKKFLYSEQEIFLRELVSNAVDATQKAKALSRKGEIQGDLGDITVRVKIDKEAKTITVSDSGLGMTAEEIDRYINQIAFSSANEFLDKYKDKIDAIIGHFGLGFYSSFMVSERVDIITKSYQEGAKAVKWSCDGSPEFTIEDAEKESRGTDVILHIDSESTAYLENKKIEDLLNRYCKFLPIPIGFGKEKEWIDDKSVETDKDIIINDINPAWKRNPLDLKDEDYKAFYKKLYPQSWEDPLFNIHLNVDYPFNLTGILYFPKIRTNLEIQKNKIQLYCNQVFVTDSVEGIVPEFLTFLHGVLDSPDIPLNVSRSYLQSDLNVKKISTHITKKVADKLTDIFKTQREDFEKKWDDLKLFIQYGMLMDEKFYEKAKDFYLLKNLDGKYFTFEEYKTIIKDNQTDKNDSIIHLYATNKIDQHTQIESAKNKGYDILLLDGFLDSHFINTIENKLEKTKFSRVDSDVIEKLIRKEDHKDVELSKEQKDELSPIFESQIPEHVGSFYVQYEALSENDLPVVITMSEYMRRMKEMGKLGGPETSLYNNLPDNYNLVVNANHPLTKQIIEEKDKALTEKISSIDKEISPLKDDLDALAKLSKDKKEEEISQDEKDKSDELNNKISDLENKKKDILKEYGKQNKLVKQVIDLALLSNNLLKGEDLTKFVKRSVEFIEK